MKNQKTKVAIIGCGNISACHMDGYCAMADEVEVIACCDIDEPKAKAYAAHWGIPHVYTDCRKMMAAEKPDAVSVCTWNAAHKDCTVAALEGGADVLCEKPMAMNATEAEEMIAAAKKAGKLLQVGFVRRFGCDADTVRAFTADGTLGNIYYGKCTYLRRNGAPGGWFGDKAFSGGGPLIDLGVHVIDLSRYLAGNPKPTEVFGVTYANLGPDRAAGGVKAWDIGNGGAHPYTVEDFVSAMIRFENGFTLSVEASFNLNVKNDSGEIALFGTKAGVKIAPNVELYTDLSGQFVNIATAGDTGFDFVKSFRAEIAGFLHAASGAEVCRASMEDGLMLMKIIDAIYASAASGKSVSITY